jgi:hypothetical protein
LRLSYPVKKSTPCIRYQLQDLIKVSGELAS